MKLIKIIFLLIISLGYLFCQDVTSSINYTEKQFQIPILKYKKTNPILELQVDIPEKFGEIEIKEVLFNLKGTKKLADIEQAELYVYDTAQMLYCSVIPNNAILVGKQKKISPNLSIKNNFTLRGGSHYLCLSITLSEKAGMYNLVNISCEKIISNRGIIKISNNHSVNHRIGIALRQHNDDNVHTYRIPTLAITKKGTLLAGYEARRLGSDDLQGDIDIGLSRSNDKGDTWSKMSVVLDMGKYGGLPEKFNGVSDPCLLVDKNSNNIFMTGLWMHGVLDDNGKWIEGLTDTSVAWNHQWINKGSQPGFGIKETCQFFISKSNDDGRTWSQPNNITEKCKQKEWWLLSPTCGNGITTKEGYLVYPTQGRDNLGESFSNITYSKDSGKTWETSTPACYNTTECSVVELDDGSIMLSMRDNRNNKDCSDKNGRAVAVTTDMGKTWNKHNSSHNGLNEPVCMASIIRHEYRENGIKKSILLFSNPNAKRDRRNLTIKVSFDNGKTWPEEYWLLLDERIGRGYSSLVSIDENTVGILYESSQADIVFQKIKLKELLKKKSGFRKIMSIEKMLNKEIMIDNNWAGESFTFMKQSGEYFVLRKSFGSGVPVACMEVYDIKTINNNKIELINNLQWSYKNDESKFLIDLNNNDVKIYNNGKQLKISERQNY